jgi:hypothetical protein
MKGLIVSIVVSVFLLMSMASLHADDTSLRCGSSLISLGDTMYEVRKACGGPAHEQRVGERRRYKVDKAKGLKIEDITYVTEWIYERDQVAYILTFEGSRLVQKTFSR